MFEKVSEILHFWFGDNKENFLSHAEKWWKADPIFDEEIRNRFGEVHHFAAAGELEHWLNQPQSCLAYIILLDQFSRNMYRGTPLAFAQDAQAKAAAHKGREHKLDKELNLIQRQFFYMPFEHSEEINDQKLCLALMKQLVDEAAKEHPAWLKEMEQSFDFAKRHYDIILNFGRFPHRNEILERESTQEELLFLSLPRSHF